MSVRCRHDKLTEIRTMIALRCTTDRSRESSSRVPPGGRAWRRGAGRSLPVRVILVDDDAAVLAALSFALKAEGFEVAVHESGRDFLAASGLSGEPGRPSHESAGEDRPQRTCLVIDQRMPEMTGLEVIQRLRAAGSQLPVIMITGALDGSLAREAAAAGVVSFLEKPLFGDALVETIRSVMMAPGAARSSDAGLGSSGLEGGGG